MRACVCVRACVGKGKHDAESSVTHDITLKKTYNMCPLITTVLAFYVLAKSVQKSLHYTLATPLVYMRTEKKKVN